MGLWDLFVGTLGRPGRSTTHRRRTHRQSTKGNFVPGLEPLEPRWLLAWTPIGPAPQQDPSALLSPTDQPLTGRVSALAVTLDTHGNQLLLLGAASGGVWWSDDFQTNSPTWHVSNTDALGLDILQTSLGRKDGRGAGLIDIGSRTRDRQDRS